MNKKLLFSEPLDIDKLISETAPGSKIASNQSVPFGLTFTTFPLVLPLENYPDGFLGINFHYLPMTLRIELLDRVVDYSNNTKFDESTRLAVDYSKLKKINLIKPALKRYLAGRVKTQFRRIDADEFTVAALLPVARFKKASASEVYKDSRAMI